VKTIEHGSLKTGATGPQWRFNTAQFNLRVEAQNWQEKGESTSLWFVRVSEEEYDGELPHELRIWIGIEPLVEGLTFDPYRVRVEADEKIVASPLSFEGARGTRGWSKCLTSHPSGIPSGLSVGRHGVRLRENELKESTKLAERTCFSLAFEIDPSPTRPFTLIIEGLELDGRPLEIPAIPFAEGTTSWTDDIS